MGSNSDTTPLWQAILLPALAGGMGWGIRGQYGHETGAMIAGVLVAATVAVLYLQQRSSLSAARLIALTAIGISFGGSMTYGQTVGLTHNGEVIGNFAALRWGLLGLFIKGAIWIGLAGGFMGIGLSRQRYGPLEACILLLVMIGLQAVGVALVNRPYVPQDQYSEGQLIAERALPNIYFSEHPDWYPDKSELKPRREGWGGLLLAWFGFVGYASFVRRDRIVRNLAVAGFIAGGFGFSIGQCVQAFHSWNPTLFSEGWFGGVSPYINWWNMMEITFGLILGGGLGLGVWWNRDKFDRTETADSTYAATSFTWDIDCYVAAAIVWVIGCWNFLSITQLDVLADRALPIAFLPLIGILGGRLFPYLFALPIVAMPIAGKTLRYLSYQENAISSAEGWITFVVGPLAVLTVAAIYSWKRSATEDTNAKWFTRWTLVLTTWFYFWINFAFFHSPWPWGEPTGRTPSAWIFWICALALTLTALTKRTNAATGYRGA